MSFNLVLFLHIILFWILDRIHFISTYPQFLRKSHLLKMGVTYKFKLTVVVILPPVFLLIVRHHTQTWFKMHFEDSDMDSDSEGPYPIIFIPKQCSSLETHCDISENVFLHLNITSPDTEKGETVIYTGLCNVKVIDGHNINIRYAENTTNGDQMPVILTEANQISFPFNDSQVWIDPSTSPYVYNRCDSPIEADIIQESHGNHITIKQHRTYITQNVYNYNEPRYSPEQRVKKPEIVQSDCYKKPETVQSDCYNTYEEDEFECGVFLSQMSEEIIHEKETKAREERKFMGIKSDNEALKQLMSTDIQSVSRQQKTILFLGHDSESGQTIQNIAINDPSLKCMETGEFDNEVIIDTDFPSKTPRAKKYQCNKCKQIFTQLSAFKQHMVSSHRISNFSDVTRNVRFNCTECGKNLKSKQQYERHCLGHGNPDLECNKCHKVFASKFTLRNHQKIHNRRYPCGYCPKSYSTESELHTHAGKVHSLFHCESCSFTSNLYSELATHRDSHADVSKHSSESELTESLYEDIIISDFSVPDPRSDDEITRSADSVIATVMKNKIFHSNPKKIKKEMRHNKKCEVCLKKFDRISDLKRHLIEHVVQSTLAKNPVDKYGVLNIRCEICQEKIFTKIDKYKAHLREHAKLTLYQCTFCDKSFSDSSNFSKHKKIHGTTYLQCDLCQRKFNSKKMIAQHMELHNKNTPVKCQYCDKEFHFKSMLNKHIRSTHNKEFTIKFRCRFCREYFYSLRNKWDHEWTVHNVRKVVVDCFICGSQFRKYSELKRHCSDNHGTIMMPTAKQMFRARKRNE